MLRDRSWPPQAGSLTSFGRGLGATIATICILSSSMPMLLHLAAGASVSEGEASAPLGPADSEGAATHRLAY